MNLPLWAVADPDGDIITETINSDKRHLLDEVFHYMPAEFRLKHWQHVQSSRKALRELGYRVVAIKIIKVRRAR